MDSDSLIDSPPIQSPPIKITTEMVAKALSKMKKGKAAGSSAKILKCSWLGVKIDYLPSPTL